MVRRTWAQWLGTWWGRFIGVKRRPGTIISRLSMLDLNAFLGRDPSGPPMLSLIDAREMIGKIKARTSSTVVEQRPVSPPEPVPKAEHYRLPDPQPVERPASAGGGGARWLLPRLELTPGQLAMVEASADHNRLVVGFPGSGKTQVLVHRADHLRRRYRIAPGAFRIFLFTNVLRDYVRSSLDLLDLPPDAVCTFDAWCRDFHAANIGRTMPRRANRPDFTVIRGAVLEFLARHGAPRGRLEFALVDEGQDLPKEAYLILKRIARHVTVFADPHQQIYDDGASMDAIREALAVPNGTVGLMGAHRNSPYISDLAARFIDDPAERALYRAQGRTVQKVKERPLLFLAPAFTAEMDRLAEVVRSRQELNQRVGILVANHRMVDRISASLKARGIETEKPLPPPPAARPSGQTWLRFDSATPKIVGLHGAKGLTFDCVLLPGLTLDAFGWMREALRHRLLFTGLARATQWAYLSATEPGALPEFTILKAAAGDGLLTVQRHESAAPSQPVPPGVDDCPIL